MFVSFEIADFYAYHFLKIEVECRKGLHIGTCVSERDYVSTFASNIRGALLRVANVKCHTQTLPAKLEQKTGADCIIIFKSGENYKVGFFEAKYPKIYDPAIPTALAKYAWDKKEAKHKISHFSKQLQLQHIWTKEIAIWEMFLNNGPSGFECPPFEAYGSSCVWHNDAYNFMHHNHLVFKPWTTEVLMKLLGASNQNIYAMIFGMLSCKNGKIQQASGLNNTFITIRNENTDEIHEIPLPTSFNSDYNESINNFLSQNRFTNYIYIDINFQQ